MARTSGPVCPVCGESRPDSKVRALRREGAPASPHWACDACIAGGRALLANPARQTVRGGPRFLAYVGRRLRCTDCRTEFEFSAAEQRFWYQTLQFVPESEPKQCRACRAARRRKRALNQTLAEALGHLDPDSASQLAAIAGIYAEMCLVRKAAEFFGRARNVGRTAVVGG